MKLAYTAIPRQLAYYAGHISRYVIEAGYVPLNPWTMFDGLQGIVDEEVLKEKPRKKGKLSV